MAGNKSIHSISIVLVGAGNLAVNLGLELHDKGFKILQVFSRTSDSAQYLAEKVGAQWTTCVEDIDSRADLYIVALKDNAFLELLPQLVKGKEKALFVHTAGSVPMSVWQGYALRYGVFYPLQTFSKQRRVDFSVIPFFIEADSPSDLNILREIAQCLSDKVIEADSAQRRQLHLAAVFACNFTNHMYDLADELLSAYGLSFDVLLPLVDETAAKVHELCPGDAQTGPAVRYDEKTIGAHLELLKDDVHKAELYRIISENIHRRALGKSSH